MEILKLIICIGFVAAIMDGADFNTKLICLSILFAGFIAHEDK